MAALLVIGDPGDPRFAGVHAVAAGHARFVPDLSAALALVSRPGEGFAPLLIVVAESRPAEVNAATLDAVRRAVPLARIWRVVGSWCEGEARSGHPPPGCLAISMDRFAGGLARELRRSADGRLPQWALPVTASREELLLESIDDDFRWRTGGTIAIRGTSAADTGALAELCRRGGYAPVVWPERAAAPARRARAILWDTTAAALAEPARVAQLRAAAPDAPVVAVAGFPRPGDVAAAHRAGIAAVVAKPFLAADLLDELDGAIAGAT